MKDESRGNTFHLIAQTGSFLTYALFNDDIQVQKLYSYNRERMLKNTVLVYFELLSQHTPGGTEDSLNRILLIIV
jgi:hypothetical protein